VDAGRPELKACLEYLRGAVLSCGGEGIGAKEETGARSSLVTRSA
jgi:hypothetical protein